MIRPFALIAALAAFALPVYASASSHHSAAAAGTMPSCPASDPVVWVNTKSHVYHAQGDAYFGKTKSGSYACTSKAVAMGAHASGAKATGKTSSTATDAPDDTATTAPVSTKHKKKHAGASPAPE